MKKIKLPQKLLKEMKMILAGNISDDECESFTCNNLCLLLQQGTGNCINGVCTCDVPYP